MKLSALLTADRILIDVKEKDKKTFLNIMLDKLNDISKVDNLDTLKKEVLDREALGNTGIGRGIGFPHAKSSQVSKITVIMARPARAIDYGSLDGKHVNIILMIIAPLNGDNNEYLHSMARISRLLGKKELREKIISLRTAEEIIDAIAAFDS